MLQLLGHSFLILLVMLIGAGAVYALVELLTTVVNDVFHVKVSPFIIMVALLFATIIIALVLVFTNECNTEMFSWFTCWVMQ